MWWNLAGAISWLARPLPVTSTAVALNVQNSLGGDARIFEKNKTKRIISHWPQINWLKWLSSSEERQWGSKVKGWSSALVLMESPEKDWQVLSRTYPGPELTYKCPPQTSHTVNRVKFTSTCISRSLETFSHVHLHQGPTFSQNLQTKSDSDLLSSDWRSAGLCSCPHWWIRVGPIAAKTPVSGRCCRGRRSQGSGVECLPCASQTEWKEEPAVTDGLGGAENNCFFFFSPPCWFDSDKENKMPACRSSITVKNQKKNWVLILILFFFFFTFLYFF